MNLECLNDIIRQNLAIYIDLTSLNSWNLNSGFTSISLTKWSEAVTDNINLYDFGLTGFDNGRTNEMYTGITITPNDNRLTLYRVGYNQVTNPTSGGTSGATAITVFSQYPISAVTSGATGNYFKLGGGYLQGFFKLFNYNYELFPQRYNDGITIETLIELLPNSNGIFYLMGTRAEDKYNTFFSGETTLLNQYPVFYAGNKTGTIDKFSGVTTSENNYLDSELPETVTMSAFRMPEKDQVKIDVSAPQIDNIRGNVIAFEITSDRKIGYKIINDAGLISTNTSDASIPATTGWTLIAITYTPDAIIPNYDPSIALCYPPRGGSLTISVNGRTFWKITPFVEFFFSPLKNDKEKQLGVPFNISWGGGSFGLKHSYHYDLENYNIYSGQNTGYINSKFFVTYNPLMSGATSGTTLVHQSGLTLTANTVTFTPETVMSIIYTGSTGHTGPTSYFIKFTQPIEILSNRVYEINAGIFDTGIFHQYNPDMTVAINSIQLVAFGNEAVNTVGDVSYAYPLTQNDVVQILHVDPNSLTFDEYQYVKCGIKYYGATNLPAYPVDILYELGYSPVYLYLQKHSNKVIVTGKNGWNTAELDIQLTSNTQKKTIYLGLLIKSTTRLVNGQPLYIKNFNYTGADIYNQDQRKNNLLIQQNFDSSFIGNIQKLRVYDRALNSSEILNNAIFESKNNPALGIKVSKGGRIIYS